MSATGQIKHLEGQEIDRARWDRCICEATNGLIYAYSFYLDRMADRWDALVLGDYEAVMPLPNRKKWGISYVYQPFLTAQLGLFGRNVSEELLKRFLQALPKHFRLIECSFNHGNLPAPEGFEIYPRINYTLNIEYTYETLQQHYRDQTKRNIRKAEKYGCTIAYDVTVEEVLGLSGLYTSPIAPQDAKNFTALYHFLKEKKQALGYGIRSARGELLASCIFFFSHNRAYYILVGNHPNGRTLGASHLLIDAFIRDHAGQKLLLDFEGSDLRNLAFFYSSFGASEELYPAIKWNRLPWWAKLLKR